MSEHWGTRWTSLGAITGRVPAHWHINARYLCPVMKTIMQIGSNDKYGQGKCNVEG